MNDKRLHVYFGGTFDPPHLGHSVMLESALNDENVVALHLVPTATNPLKNSEVKKLGSLEDRKRWVELWLKAEKTQSKRLDIVKVEDLEWNSNEAVQYTIDTLREIKKKHPNVQWAMLLGEDSLENLALWKDVKDLLKNELSELWVFSRNSTHNPLSKIPPELRSLCAFRWIPVKTPMVSSTQLRKLLMGADALQKLEVAELLDPIKEDLKRLVL